MNNLYNIKDKMLKNIFIIYTFLLIINLFFPNRFIVVIELIMFAIIVLLYNPNNLTKCIKYINQIKSIKSKNKTKSKTDSEHIYKKCHHCKSTLKLPLPKKRGIKHSICPVCKKRDTFIINKKIEIITNKR